MSNLSNFLKANKIKKENATYPATKSLIDEEGKPLLWTIKPLTTRDNDRLRDECTIQVQVKGKPNMTKPELDTSKYIAKMIATSVVEPNLNNKELQDSYGVMTPEELIKEMVDNPGEYNNFAKFIQEYNGFDETLNEKVEKSKKLIKEDSETSYAYYCLHKFHWLPSTFTDLEENEKALVIAMIQEKAEKDDKEIKKLKERKNRKEVE